MIDILPGLPSNVIGFKATGEVTKEDYEKVVFPGIRKHTDTSKELNFVFYVDTPLKNFSPGAWLRDIWLQVKKFAAWHKVAIISDVERVRRFTDSISFLLPGQYKGFLSSELEEAVRWAATDEQRPSPSVHPAYLEELLPPQVKGANTETSASVVADNEEHARYIFETARERLLDVNNWTDHCIPMSTVFQLSDDAGEPLQGRATEGDFIQIDLPGRGPREGRDYDWVRIEKVALYTTTNPIFLLQVRPTYDPQQKGSTRTAHFLEESATSTFTVEMDGNKVTATIFGRNEVPNTPDPGSGDKLRNGVGSIGAAGLSKMQWKSLVHGLLEKE
ncbi:MAG TPA: STAS/SEC14 domain-containing protein [Puia sp.]|jgi:hypothetical protein|nr:STAS/SEC14 domain-containing protein [Puia sp.]